MMETVTAVRFDRRTDNGKTWPCLLACERANGDEVEVIAKFSGGSERKTGGLVAEAIAAMLAADLGLRVPEPFVMALDDGFIDLVSSRDAPLAERMRASSRYAFGSLKLPPGFTTLPIGARIPDELRAQAADVFAFDCLIENPDRRPDNPNLLSNGRSLAIIDHELAFLTTTLFWQPVWKPGSLGTHGRGPHALHQALRERSYDFARLEAAWAAISDARLDQYRAAVPPEWIGTGDVVDTALALIADVRDHIRPALAEVARVLA